MNIALELCQTNGNSFKISPFWLDHHQKYYFYRVFFTYACKATYKHRMRTLPSACREVYMLHMVVFEVSRDYRDNYLHSIEH
jgi:hypothetical protein